MTYKLLALNLTECESNDCYYTLWRVIKYMANQILY